MVKVNYMIIIAGMLRCLGLFGLPKRCGKLKDLTKFDASFFAIHPKLADSMDPQIRMLLEVTYEALYDAGRRSAKLNYRFH